MVVVTRVLMEPSAEKAQGSRDSLPSCPGMLGQPCVLRALGPGGWQRTLKKTLMGTVLSGDARRVCDSVAIFRASGGRLPAPLSGTGLGNCNSGSESESASFWPRRVILVLFPVWVGCGSHRNVTVVMCVPARWLFVRPYE